MRTSMILLIFTLVAPAGMKAQAQVQSEDFAISAFILALRFPLNVANADGTPLTSGPVLWLAIKNVTATPYSLCTTGTGWSIGTGGVLGAGNCSDYWILLPGETQFQSVRMPMPQEPDSTLSATIMLEGKPLGLMGDLRRWTLRWSGTVAEATALGERMKAKVP